MISPKPGSGNRLDLPRDGYTGIAALSFGATPGDLFAAADACAFHVLEHSHCTVNRFNAEKMELTRLYSSNMEKYPIGGTKSKSGTNWGRHVLLNKLLFVGQGLAAIKNSFEDHELIASLGLRSVINVPLVCEGNCLGTLNFLSREDRVTQRQIDFAQRLGLLIIPGMLASEI